jgi:two-component system, cell cycle sensor histidine kinase and response regulator CckA
MAMKHHNDLIFPATASGIQEMGLHPVTLAFPGHLEKDFLHYYYENSLSMMRFSLFCGIVIYGLFGILDAYVVPEIKGKLWAIRFFIVCPSLLVVILLSYRSDFNQYIQLSIAAVMFISGLGIVFMIALMPPPVNYSYYAGIILVFIWGYSFTKVRFVWASTVGWLIVIFYEFAAVWITDTPSQILFSNNFFLIGSQIAGMAVCYSIEYYARRDFYLACLLENEKHVVLEANQRLESIIAERTAELMKINISLRTEVEERKRAEEQRAELENKLLQAQKMEAIGTLAGGIAHDFNNLLMGIEGNTELLLMNRQQDHVRQERLKNIQSLVQSGSSLTRQLLGFARSGKYEVKPTDINELLDRCSQMFGRTNKGTTMHAQLLKNIWTVNVDQGQIEQVFFNLLVNAWQAMPGGGNLFIRTANVIPDEHDAVSLGLNPVKYVKISIEDTGVGMDEITLPRIFDPFFTTKEVGRGTGLGLASAYGIVKNHDGIITVSSVKGQGTTFEIYLPAVDNAAENKIALQTPELGAIVHPWGLPQDNQVKSGEGILFVDDEAMNIETFGEILELYGYKVFKALSGREAVDIYQAMKGEIRLVILDIVMPGMGGGETFDILKAFDPDIKVLLSSGYSVSGKAADILDRGCAGFIQKPYDINNLIEKIRNILDNTKEVEEAKTGAVLPAS